MAALLSLPLTLLPLFIPYNFDFVSFIFLCQQQEQKWLRFLGKPARALVPFLTIFDWDQTSHCGP
jgi:hypothetical protein